MFDLLAFSFSIEHADQNIRMVGKRVGIKYETKKAKLRGL
jgi:hypothetical protein